MITTVFPPWLPPSTHTHFNYCNVKLIDLIPMKWHAFLWKNMLNVFMCVHSQPRFTHWLKIHKPAGKNNHFLYLRILLSGENIELNVSQIWHVVNKKCLCSGKQKKSCVSTQQVVEKVVHYSRWHFNSMTPGRGRLTWNKKKCNTSLLTFLWAVIKNEKVLQPSCSTHIWKAGVEL